MIVGVNLNENWTPEFQQLSESDTLNETWDRQEGILNVYTKQSLFAKFMLQKIKSLYIDVYCLNSHQAKDDTWELNKTSDRG